MDAADSNWTLILVCQLHWFSRFDSGERQARYCHPLGLWLKVAA